MSIPNGLNDLQQRKRKSQERRARQVPPPRHSAKDLTSLASPAPTPTPVPEVQVAEKVEAPLVVKTTKRLVAEPPLTYARKTFYVRPDQAAWLKDVSRNLPDGLSASDVVRLALDELAASGGSTANLAERLTKQALRDAEQFSGRKNRGLPSSD